MNPLTATMQTVETMFTAMDRSSLEELKRRIPIEHYLQDELQWQPDRRLASYHVTGLCPLHAEKQPSFSIQTRKNLFYCHGCGQGGDVIRLVEILHQMTFPQALAHLRSRLGGFNLLEDAVAYYRAQLPRSPQALQFLALRGISDPATIRAMRIGYAPGA